MKTKIQPTDATRADYRLGRKLCNRLKSVLVQAGHKVKASCKCGGLAMIWVRITSPIDGLADGDKVALRMWWSEGEVWDGTVRVFATIKQERLPPWSYDWHDEWCLVGGKIPMEQVTDFLPIVLTAAKSVRACLDSGLRSPEMTHLGTQETKWRIYTPEERAEFVQRFNRDSREIERGFAEIREGLQNLRKS